MVLDSSVERSLRRALGPEHALPEPAFRAFAALLVPRALTPGEHWLLAGGAAGKAAFVVRGALREYYADADGAEHNKAFAFAGDFTGSYADLLARAPSATSIQALRASLLLVFDFPAFLSLSEREPAWMRLRCLAAERLLVRKVERERVLMSHNPAQRYAQLRKHWPELESKVSQRHVASYLGITPVTLSRVRARLGVARRRSTE